MSNTSNNNQEEGNKNLKRISDENANINIEFSNKNFDSSGILPLMKKKRSRLGIKKEEELDPAFICNSNEVTFFKIVHNEEEFRDFQNLSNLEHCFNPVYSNQVFNTEETITGYKNLKILVSLTPKFLQPHIKILYDKCLKIRDDLDLLLKQKYEHVYETSDEKFLEKLNEELKVSNNLKGEKIFSLIDQNSGKLFEVM
jgi:hypothetical protein